MREKYERYVGHEKRLRNVAIKYFCIPLPLEIRDENLGKTMTDLK